MVSVRMRKAQIAIEFMLLVAVGLFFFLIIVASVVNLATGKQSERFYYDLQDFGKAIQRELILATELEDGYHRNIKLPYTAPNGKPYTIYTNNTPSGKMYLFIEFEEAKTIEFEIPTINGTIRKGTNTIYRERGEVYVR